MLKKWPKFYFFPHTAVTYDAFKILSDIAFNHAHIYSGFYSTYNDYTDLWNNRVPPSSSIQAEVSGIYFKYKDADTAPSITHANYSQISTEDLEEWENIHHKKIHHLYSFGDKLALSDIETVTPSGYLTTNNIDFEEDLKNTSPATWEQLVNEEIQHIGKFTDHLIRNIKSLKGKINNLISKETCINPALISSVSYFPGTYTLTLQRHNYCDDCYNVRFGNIISPKYTNTSSDKMILNLSTIDIDLSSITLYFDNTKYTITTSKNGFYYSIYFNDLKDVIDVKFIIGSTEYDSTQYNNYFSFHTSNTVDGIKIIFTNNRYVKVGIST